MTPLAELQAQDCLFLDSIDEPDANSLRLVVTAARPQPDSAEATDPPVSGAVPVAPDSTTPTFELLFESYVAYLVRNESYARNLPDETWDGSRTFRQYSASAFLEYIRQSTIATDSYPGPVRHFAVVCVDHVVDVVSLVPPIVRPMERQLDV
jgi:hypothetical protein